MAQVNRHRYRNLIMALTLSVVFVFGACERDLDIDLGDAGGKPVLYAFLQPDTGLVLSLSKSVSILNETHYDLYQNASVLIYKNGAPLQTLSYPNGEASYSWPQIKFNAGDSVTFSVFVDGAELASGQTQIPNPVPIESVDTLRVLKKGPSGLFEMMMRVRVYFTDPLDEANFYQLILLQKRVVEQSDGSSATVVDTISIPKDDALFYNSNQGSSSFETIDFQGLFNDQTISHRPYGIVLYLPVATFDDGEDVLANQLIFRLYHLNSLYYSFLRAQIIAASYEGLPIFNPVQAPSNVSNGFGVVTSLTCSVDTLDVL
ncbi:MAG: DUF4249 domain-containing protein [Breznakibacter sp.]